MLTTMEATKWTVKAWAVDGFDHIPYDAVTVEAGSAKEAKRLAARHFGFQPHDWCFKHSRFELEAYRGED